MRSALISHSLTRPPWTFLVRNDSWETAPSQGLIWVPNGYDTRHNIFAGRRPRWGGKTLFCIVPHDIAPGKTGRCIYRGKGLVTVSLTAGQTVKNGDRLDFKHDSWYAQKAQLGTMLVEDVLSQTATEAVCRVVKSETRGDCVFTSHGDGDPQNTAHVWRFGTGFTVTLLRIGTVLVEKT